MDAEKKRLEVHPVLSPPGEVLGLSTGASEWICLELEVGDIARGAEVRSESSPVEEGTKGDQKDVIVAVC